MNALQKGRDELALVAVGIGVLIPEPGVAKEDGLHLRTPLYKLTLGLQDLMGWELHITFRRCGLGHLDHGANRYDPHWERQVCVELRLAQDAITVGVDGGKA